jgi:hypothetical protein
MRLSARLQIMTRNKLRGVTYDAVTKKWRARLYCRGRHIDLGRYATALLAARAHDRAANYVFKENALTNFGQAGSKDQLPIASSRTMLHLNVMAWTMSASNCTMRALRRIAAMQSGALEVATHLDVFGTRRPQALSFATHKAMIRTLVFVATACGPERVLMRDV